MRSRLGILVAGALAGACGMSSLAKADGYGPASYARWTGFYVGANVGGSWGNSDNDWFTSNSFQLPPTPGCLPSGSFTCLKASDSSKLDGAIGGVQAGYNWQASNFVFGFETDFQGTSQSSKDTVIGSVSLPQFFGPVSATGTVSDKENLPWLGTVRGRLGIANNGWLIYATGGLAYGRVSTNTVIHVSTIPGSGFPDLLAHFGDEATRVGWTVGAGVEKAIASTGWSLKAEYLHVDLGSHDTSFATNGVCAGNSSLCFFTQPGTGSVERRLTDEIVRIGLNYKFGDRRDYVPLK